MADQHTPVIGQPVDAGQRGIDLKPSQATANQQVTGSQLRASEVIGNQPVTHSDEQDTLEKREAHSVEHSRKIITTHVFPPIPIRSMDWQAYFDGDEPNDDGQMLHGEGATEQEAIDDLLMQAEDAE